MGDETHAEVTNSPSGKSRSEAMQQDGVGEEATDGEDRGK